MSPPLASKASFLINPKKNSISFYVTVRVFYSIRVLMASTIGVNGIVGNSYTVSLKF